LPPHFPFSPPIKNHITIISIYTKSEVKFLGYVFNEEIATSLQSGGKRYYE
jgi:hypothetical protein